MAAAWLSMRLVGVPWPHLAALYLSQRKVSALAHLSVALLPNKQWQPTQCCPYPCSGSPGRLVKAGLPGCPAIGWVIKGKEVNNGF